MILPGSEPSGGTAYTRDEAARLGRPHLLTDGVEPAVVRAWLETLPHGMTLNVAGPRESKAPGIYVAVTALLDALDT